MLPCTCGHFAHHHDTDDGSCTTCGCAAFIVEGDNCEALTADEQHRGVALADRGCRAGGAPTAPE